MKRLIKVLSLMAAVAAMAMACTKGGEGGGQSPPNPNPDERVVLTRAAGFFMSEKSTPDADYVELTFREGDFDEAGNPTGRGTLVVIPCYTKPAVSDVRVLASGVYNPVPETGAARLTFIPGDEASQTGARVVSYDDNGEGQTRWLSGGSFSVTKSAETYTIAFDMSETVAVPEEGVEDGEEPEGEMGTEITFMADFTGPLTIADETGYVTLDICAAGYFDDNYNVGTYYWQFEVYRNDEATGLQEGLTMFLSMSTNYHFDTGQWQDGVYTPSSDFSAGTFYQGQIVGGTGAEGSMCVLIVNGKQALYVVSGGTFALEATGNGEYSILANLELANPNETRRAVFRYNGTPKKENKSYKNRTWNGVFTRGEAEYYGPTSNNSDRWQIELSWPDETNPDESRVYIVELYGPKGGGKTTLPTGTFPMATQTQQYVAGTMEPGWMDLSDKRGTWMTSRMGVGERANPSPATEGKGSITITSKGDGKYDFSVNFEEEARKNKFNGTGTNLAVNVVDSGPQDMVLTGWNAHSLLNYNGVKKEGVSNSMTASLMAGTLNWNGERNGMTSLLQGTGRYVRLDLCVSPTETRYIPLGVYTRNTTQNPFTLGGMSWVEDWDDNNPSGRKSWTVVGGTVNVRARTGDTYTIELDLLMYDGSTAKGTFVGNLQYIDSSEE